MKNRDDFDSKTVEVLAKRASFICSYPNCRCLTLSASDADQMKFIYNGKAAHITAAAEGGPRYNKNLTPQQRSDISNGIFLCSNCAEMIDKNKGIDFPEPMLVQWKSEHEEWVKTNLNKSVDNSIVLVDGEHHAKGIGNVTGLEIKKSAIIQPGTIVTAEGIGNITGTKIG